MKKAFKIYGVAWIIAIVVPLLIFLFLFCFERIVGSDELNGVRELAEDPEHIENIIEIDFPDVYHIDSDTNSDDRSDIYTYHVQFSEDLSYSDIEELEERCNSDQYHWSKGEDHYRYFLHPEGSRFNITCLVYHDCYKLEYEVYKGMTTSASVRYLIYMTIITLLVKATGVVVCLLGVWGIILLIIALVRKFKS